MVSPTLTGRVMPLRREGCAHGSIVFVRSVETEVEREPDPPRLTSEQPTPWASTTEFIWENSSGEEEGGLEAHTDAWVWD